jgi:hypothetical protein
MHRILGQPSTLHRRPSHRWWSTPLRSPGYTSLPLGTCRPRRVFVYLRCGPRCPRWPRGSRPTSTLLHPQRCSSHGSRPRPSRRRRADSRSRSRSASASGTTTRTRRTTASASRCTCGRPRSARRCVSLETQRRALAERVGFLPTDPCVLLSPVRRRRRQLTSHRETLSSHDKKRAYVECMEQYIEFLHQQLRLVGHEPVAMEKVESYSGLNTRSIRVSPSPAEGELGC